MLVSSPEELGKAFELSPDAILPAQKPLAHTAQSSRGFHSFDSPAKQGTRQRTPKTPPQGIGEEVARAHLDVCTITGGKEQTQPGTSRVQQGRQRRPGLWRCPGCAVLTPRVRGEVMQRKSGLEIVSSAHVSACIVQARGK